MRVLVAEDEKVLADLVAAGLRSEAMAVDVAYDGLTAHERLAVHDYDVVVLDRDLPGMHGDDICSDLARSASRTKVLMLTAAGSLDDRVDGLELGADDYPTKPFEYPELVARVRAQGTVVSSEQLLRQAWDEHADPFTNAVRVAMSKLRSKLGEPQVIETVPGAGYRI